MFPTTILIDPAGNLVKGNAEHLLAVRISEGKPAVQERAKKLSAGERETTLALLAQFGPVDGEDGLCVLNLFLHGCLDPECADAALEAMGRIGGEPSIAWIIEGGLRSPAARRQERAAVILGKSVPTGYLQMLFEFAEKPGTVQGAVRAICDAFAVRSGEDPDIRGVLDCASKSTANPVLAAAAKAALAKIR